MITTHTRKCVCSKNLIIFNRHVKYILNIDHWVFLIYNFKSDDLNFIRWYYYGDLISNYTTIQFYYNRYNAYDIFWKLEKTAITFSSLSKSYEGLQHHYRFAHREVSISTPYTFLQVLFWNLLRFLYIRLVYSNKTCIYKLIYDN